MCIHVSCGGAVAVVFMVRSGPLRCQVAEGKPLNAFCLEERCMPAAFAKGVIERMHASWRAAHGAKRSAALHFYGAEEEAAKRPKL